MMTYYYNVSFSRTYAIIPCRFHLLTQCFKALRIQSRVCFSFQYSYVEIRQFEAFTSLNYHKLQNHFFSRPKESLVVSHHQNPQPISNIHSFHNSNTTLNSFLRTTYQMGLSFLLVGGGKLVLLYHRRHTIMCIFSWLCVYLCHRIVHII